MRSAAAIAIIIAMAGCRALLGIDDEVTVRDSVSIDGAIDGATPLDGDTVDAPLDAATACPASYTTRGLATYRLVTEPQGWLAAATDCGDDLVGSTTLFTHLAVISVASERNAIQELDSGGELWIGLSRRRGLLAWVTAEPASVPDPSDPTWATGEPDEEGQDCVFLEDELYADNACDTPRRFVCECDSYPNDPNRY